MRLKRKKEAVISTSESKVNAAHTSLSVTFLLFLTDPPLPNPANGNPSDNMDLCEPVTPYSPLSAISQYEGQSTFCILIMFPITKSMPVHFLTQS